MCVLAVMALGTGLLAGCGKSSKTADSQTEDQMTDLVIYGVPDPQISAAQVIAKEEGYFEEEGLNVENKLVANSPEVGPMLASGECDIALAGSYALMTWVNAGIPVKSVVPMVDIGGTQDSCISKDIELNSPKDLEGLNVGCTKGSESEIILQRMCDDLGVDYSSLNIVTLQGADMLSAFEKGDIDIIAANEPWIVKAEKQYDAKFLMSGTKSEIPGSDEDTHWLSVYTELVVNNSYLEENPEIVQKVIAALEKATDFINDHRDEAVKILSKEFDLDEDDLKIIMERNDYTMGVSQDYIDWSNYLANYIKEKDIIQKDLSIDDYNQFDIVKENFPELYHIED